MDISTRINSGSQPGPPQAPWHPDPVGSHVEPWVLPLWEAASRKSQGSMGRHGRCTHRAQGFLRIAKRSPHRWAPGRRKLQAALMGTWTAQSAGHIDGHMD